MKKHPVRQISNHQTGSKSALQHSTDTASQNNRKRHIRNDAYVDVGSGLPLFLHHQTHGSRQHGQCHQGRDH